MSQLKQQILNLFQDNQSGDITPSDMRVFINAIFDSTQGLIPVIDTKNDIAGIPDVSLNDVVIVTGATNQGDKGVYIATSAAPTGAELLIISTPEYVKSIADDVNSGLPGQILYTDANGLFWGSPPVGHRIIGTDTIQNILLKSPSVDNHVYIAINDEPFAIIPGVRGDGYSWNLLSATWSNVGQLRGPQGDSGAQGNIGPQGNRGTDGTNGQNGTDGTNGIDGTNGTDGIDGVNSIIRGTKTYNEILAIVNPQIGETWISSTEEPLSGILIGDGITFTLSGWANVGQMRGPLGPIGPDGPAGIPGPIGPQGDYLVPLGVKPLAEILQIVTADIGETWIAENPGDPTNPLPERVQIGNDTEGNIVFSGDWISARTPNEWITLGSMGITGPQGPQGIEGPDGPPAYNLQGQETAEEILRKPRVHNDAWIVERLWNDPLDTRDISDEQAKAISIRDLIYCTDAFLAPDGTPRLEWVTVGPLGVTYATRAEAEAGCTNGIDNKAISPDTMCWYTTQAGMLRADGSVAMLPGYDPETAAVPTFIPGTTRGDLVVNKNWVETRTIDGGSFAGTP